MAERVIWERTIDQDKIRDRAARFRKQFFPAAGVAVLVVFFLGGTPNALGAMLALALVGLVWGNTVRYKSLSDAANPIMTVDGGRLTLGNRSVILEDVKRFTTIATSIQTSLLGRYSRVHVGKAIFRMDNPGTNRDPQLIEFGWPNMTEEGVATVRAALEPELPGKWVEPVDMVDESEVPPQEPRGRRGRRPRRP